MVTGQLQVERRRKTGKIRRLKTYVPPLCHATNRNLFQTSDSLTLNDEDLLESQRSHSGSPTPRTKQEDSGHESLTNEHTEKLHSSTTESGVMPLPHSIALDIQLLFRHLVHLYTEATVLSIRPTSCKPYVLRKRTCPKLTLSLSQHYFYCTLYFESDLPEFPFTPWTHMAVNFSLYR